MKRSTLVIILLSLAPSAVAQIQTVRQDTTASMAKESGGNLATIAAKDFATQVTLASLLATANTLNGKIPASPATDRSTAAAPFSIRLSDGAAFYKATTPSDTQPTSAADASNVALGALADAAVGDGSGTVNSHLRNLNKLFTAVTFGDVNNAASIAGAMNVSPVGRYDATQPTLTNGRFNLFQVDSRGSLFIAKGVGGFTIDNTAFTANAGTNLNTSALALSATQTDRTQKVQVTDGTRDGTVKAASTAASATDTAFVVALSPNSPLGAGTAVIGHVITDSGSTTVVTGTVAVSAASLPLPASAATDASVTNSQVTPGTTAESKVTIVGGKSNDGTAQYKEIPLGTSARSVIVEGFTGATAVPVTLTSTTITGTPTVSDTALELSQASTTSGQKGPIVQGAVTTSAPSYTTAQTNPLSLTTGGALRSDVATIAGTAPTTAGKFDVKGADGDVFVRQTTAANLNMTEASAAASKTDLDTLAGVVTSSRAAVNLIVGQSGIAGGTGVDGATVPRVSLATNVGLPAGTSLLGKVGIDQTTPGSTNAVSATNFPSTVDTNAGSAGASTPRVVLAYDGQITLQASQVSGTTNATTTRTTTTGLGPYRSVSFLVNVTGAGAATGTFQVFLEDSLDGGTTWNDLVSSNTFTFGGSVTSQTFTVNETGDADSPVLANALSTTVTTVVSTPGVLESYFCYNPNTIVGYVQIFDVSGTVTLGTTTPKQSFAIPPGAAGNLSRMFQGYVNAIKVAATTTATGSSALTTAMDCNFTYHPIIGQGGLAAVETLAAGAARQGPFGDRIRVREKVSGVSGSPTGVTYTVSAVFKR